MRRIRTVVGLVGLALLWGGCASTMMVFTEPGDAEILVDGRMIGRSPVLYEGSSVLDGGVEVTARLPGYRATTVEVSREPNAAHLGESVLFPVFAPWGWYLPDAVHIRLVPVKESRGAGGGSRWAMSLREEERHGEGTKPVVRSCGFGGPRLLDRICPGRGDIGRGPGQARGARADRRTGDGSLASGKRPARAQE